MLSSDHFNEYYKTISNAELLAILQDPDQYQPLAVEAARKELSARLLSETDISKAKNEISEKVLQKEQQKEKIKAIETKIKTTSNTIFDTINPIQPRTPTAERTIRMITIVFAVIFLYSIIMNLKTYYYTLGYIDMLPFHVVLHFLPLVFLGAGIYNFWKRKRVGWILLIAFFIYSAIIWLWTLGQTLLWEPTGIPAFEDLRPPFMSIIFIVLFYAGATYAVCRKDVRKVFEINENKMIAVLIFSVVASSLLLFSAFHAAL